jgi:threonyl-tRNA synthetase
MMLSITLPDGSKQDLPKGSTGLDLAKSIGPGLAKSAVAISIDGVQKDLEDKIEQDSSVSIITIDSSEGLEIMRHTIAAQVLAASIKTLYPDSKLAIGPTIDNGFYYDILSAKAISSDDLVTIEKEMQRVIENKSVINKTLHSKKEVIKFFKDKKEDYKLKIINEAEQDNNFQIFTNEDTKFIDLCIGPHLPNLSFIGPFKLTKVSGAYWKGDSSNEMLTRIYGTAWRTQKDLDTYLSQIEEAEKRDHRKIGKDLDLFSIQEDAGGGLVFWHPNGARVRNIIENYWKEEHQNANYDLLYTPHIALDTLWQTSGHTDFYEESMYKPIEDENQLYRLKPMNCPFHVLIYKNTLRSYRDLPIRWAELGTVYRHEMTGALHGLMRVRGFTQDDSHIFCSEDQIEQEIKDILDLALKMLKTFTFEEFEIHLATRPEKFVGSEDIWDKATDALRKALESKKLDYKTDIGGGAFYGPKIDIKIKDAIGRLWQCSTIQLDFNLPERFDMNYIGNDGKKYHPIMIHRALLGSIERFFGILVEHFAGKFPLWLAPTQICVMTINQKQNKYAQSICEEIKKNGFRVEIDLRNEKIGSKIRDHTLKKVPYLIILGDREFSSKEITVRTQKGDDLGNMELKKFIKNIEKELVI